MSKISTFFILMIMFQTAGAIEVGTIAQGKNLPFAATKNLGESIEQGWKVMGSKTMHLGDVQADSVCQVTNIAEITCEIIYDPQYINGSSDSSLKYDYLNKVTVQMSYLDGLAGEEIRQFKLETVKRYK